MVAVTCLRCLLTMVTTLRFREIRTEGMRAEGVSPWQDREAAWRLLSWQNNYRLIVTV